MTARDLNSDLAFAHRLADAAGAAILPHFRNLQTVANKATEGFDPVTIADKAAETAIRELIDIERPEDGIRGEEFPEKTSQTGWSWTLDPIDGTRGFIAGTPTWCVLIALAFEGKPVLGLIDQPHTGERFSGLGAEGFLRTRAGRNPLAASSIATLADAILATTDPYLFEKDQAEAFARVRRGARLTRYGMDAYAYGLLAAGGVDVVVESGLDLHDLHALIPVVKASGGVISDWKGGEDFRSGNLLAAATPALQAEVLALLEA
ncbi:inositol monophosphatase family protein [Hyphobacterium sp.]|uniref:inositol monophosphatase family protein n=1 Tax=Hyphobacterium sp. TaxID=2004662 RepID=UPI003BABD60B